MIVVTQKFKNNEFLKNIQHWNG